MKKILCLSVATLLLSGCTPATQQVMSPLRYNQSIDVHVNKTAYLYWQPGEIHGSELPRQVSYNSGIAGALVSAAIDTQMRKNNPSHYTFTYGKAQQAVFMTSFRDVLLQNHVFKDVILTTDLSRVKSQDVLLKVYFKSTKVGPAGKNYQITLDVDMSIEANKSTFTRSYVAESDGSYFSFKNFKDQQTDASQQLLSKLIGGIKQWQVKKS